MATQYFSTKEIAAHFHVHRQTVLKWVRSNVIPVIRINPRCFRFNLQACEEAMNRRTVLAAI